MSDLRAIEGFCDRAQPDKIDHEENDDTDQPSKKKFAHVWRAGLFKTITLRGKVQIGFRLLQYLLSSSAFIRRSMITVGCFVLRAPSYMGGVRQPGRDTSAVLLVIFKFDPPVVQRRCWRATRVGLSPLRKDPGR